MAHFAWDASDFDWPRGPMDLIAARAAGIEMFTHKATEGSPGTRTAFEHVHYPEAMRRARDAGIPVLGAYHVVRSPADASDEVDYHLDYVDRLTPWWRDWPAWRWQVDLEKWPYDPVAASEGEQFADIIEARTGRPAVLYASRGQYGDQLTGTSHMVWNANYGPNNAGDFRDLYEQRGGDDGPGWDAYSGQTPGVWQYGSRATIGRQPGCDANAIRDEAVWAALTGDDMGLSKEEAENQAKIVYALDAILNNRPTVADGPWKGTRNMVHDRLNELAVGGIDPVEVAAAVLGHLDLDRAVAEVIGRTTLTVPPK